MGEAENDLMNDPVGEAERETEREASSGIVRRRGENVTIGPHAVVADDVVLGEGVRLIGFCNLYGCSIGNGTIIGPFVEIQSEVSVGARCKIQSHSFLCSDLVIEDGVFVGHGVMFINDRNPAAVNQDGSLKRTDDWVSEPIRVSAGASIGSNATIMCGVTIGVGAVIGAGAVVLGDVAAGVTVVGNPARVV